MLVQITHTNSRNHLEPAERSLLKIWLKKSRKWPKYRFKQMKFNSVMISRKTTQSSAVQSRKTPSHQNFSSWFTTRIRKIGRIWGGSSCHQPIIRPNSGIPKLPPLKMPRPTYLKTGTIPRVVICLSTASCTSSSTI